MILPDKYVTLSESYIGLSALLLEILSNKKMTIDQLWNRFYKKYNNSQKLSNMPTYQKYLCVLEFMYIVNMIDYNERGEILNENIKLNN